MGWPVVQILKGRYRPQQFHMPTLFSLQKAIWAKNLVFSLSFYPGTLLLPLCTATHFKCITFWLSFGLTIYCGLDWKPNQHLQYCRYGKLHSKLWTKDLQIFWMLTFIHFRLITLKLLTFLGHWMPQLCRLCFLSSLGDVHSLQCTYNWLRPQWHCTRSIWLHGRQSPGWQRFRQVCTQPFGRGLVQPDSHCSQLSPAYKITYKRVSMKCSCGNTHYELQSDTFRWFNTMEIHKPMEDANMKRNWCTNTKI